MAGLARKFRDTNVGERGRYSYPSLCKVSRSAQREGAFRVYTVLDSCRVVVRDEGFEERFAEVRVRVEVEVVGSGETIEEGFPG